MFKKASIILILVAFMTSPVLAQTETAGNNESISVSEEGLISLDFREADIRNVLQILALKSGVNIVSSPEVNGIITIRLNQVPWKQALEVILRTNGFAYDQRGNIITVTTVEDMKRKREDAILLADQEPLSTETFTLNFGKASEIIVSIEKMKSDRGSIDFDDRTNTLIITDIPGKIELMGGVIQKLDTTTPQVLIEAKIVETNFVDQENLGIDWVTKATITGSARPHTYPFTVSTANKYASGSNFPAAADTDFTYGTLDFAQVQAVFELLKTKTDTNILSSPRIVTLDNQPAQIVVGEQYPIPTYTYNEEQARLQVSGWEYKDIGIIFDVTPHVNSAGFVTLEIEPKITEIKDFVTVENTSLPRLTNESANTKVLIKDGETVVIAGLVKNKTIDTRKKTPILGDIPIVGLVFQKKETQVDKQDLMIFMTPHVITPKFASSK